MLNIKKTNNLRGDNMNIAKKYSIQQIRLIHNAFRKDQGDHVATYVPSTPFMNPFQACEELYSKTQNIETSWVKDAVVGGSKTEFTVKPQLDTRSTCVGDIMAICYLGENGFREVWYTVADVGFEKYYGEKRA